MEYANTLKAVLDNSPDSIIFISPEHKIIAFNKTIDEVHFKYFKKRLQVGNDYRDSVSPGSKELYFNLFSKALNGEAITVQNQTKTEDISVWFEFTMNPVYSPSCEILGVMFTSKNIDKQKKVELELEYLAETINAIFENTIETIVLLDKDCKLIRCNKAAIESMKEKRNKVLSVGEDFRDILDKVEKDEFTQIFNKAIQGEATYTEIISTVNDVTYWFQIRMQPVYKKDGALLGVSMFSANATQTKKAESSLKDNEDKFKEIAWNQSHIIRTPVAKIMGIINIIKEYPELSESEKLQWIDHLLTTAEELDTVIKNIVSLTGSVDEEEK